MDNQSDKILEILENAANIAYFPATQKTATKSSINSKFGGLPHLNEENEWAVCTCCKKPMTFFMQLNLETLPIKYANNKGLLQLFICTQRDCNAASETYAPFSEGVVIRILDILKPSAIANLGENKVATYPELNITRWEMESDYPHSESYHKLGIVLTPENYNIVADKETALQGDKLLGWPCFIQGHQEVFDPEDNTPYEYLFQLDSEDNIPFMFGDGGTAYIYYHPNKPEKLAMFWQAY